MYDIILHPSSSGSVLYVTPSEVVVLHVRNVFRLSFSDTAEGIIHRAAADLCWLEDGRNKLEHETETLQ